VNFLATGNREMSLQGQTAIVTGAGSPAGIGFAIARGLLRAGAHQVAITATTERIYERARELDETGKNVVAIVADLTEEDSAQRIVDAVMQRSGRIDVLVNNAGMAQTGRTLEGDTVRESAYADWRRQIEITLRVRDDTRGTSGDGTKKIRSHCECVFGDRAAGKQSRFGRLWGGKSSHGRDDACDRAGNGTRRNHH
jgi:NAD(P)-dependent dehydrogenase (short-subunit alcohol dehydrogenase family)